MSWLPNNEIGISDILDYRECPQRFAWSMRRHRPMPDHFKIEPDEKDVPPEKNTIANAYGSFIHDAIEIVEKEQVSDDEAITRAWPPWQRWLEVPDQERAKADLETYRMRTQTGWRLIGTEIELRMPLFTFEGETIYLRGRIDALYQHIQNGSLFLSRDYKSSRWPRSETEVHTDLQQWCYNVLIHYNYPECEGLTQLYDQLRFGDIPTRKSEKQRQQMKAWLIRQVTAILKDEKMKPQQNDWCYTCPLVMDCRVTHRSTDYWKNRLAILAPERKEGRKIVIELDPDEIFGFETYVEELPKAKRTLKQLERFVDEVETTLKEMGEERRAELGYGLARPRQRSVWGVDALRRAHELAGDAFYALVGITKKSLEEMYEEDDPVRAEIEGMAESRSSAPSLKAIRD